MKTLSRIITNNELISLKYLIIISFIGRISIYHETNILF